MGCSSKRVSHAARSLQLLDYATATMLQSRSRQHGAAGRPETAQLLLIVSDGRGLFLEGVEMVRTAVRRARHANVFLVFVIIDNPQNKVNQKFQLRA